jgi:hypothetical protein
MTDATELQSAPSPTSAAAGTLTVPHIEREPKLEVCSMIDTRYLPFVGRLFIGLPFIVSGLGIRKAAAGNPG